MSNRVGVRVKSSVRVRVRVRFRVRVGARVTEQRSLFLSGGWHILMTAHLRFSSSLGLDWG